MKKFVSTVAVLAAILLPHLYATDLQAQVLHTFISITGNDANTASECQLSAPCQSFEAAYSKTAEHGHVSCLDTGTFSSYPFTITQSITLDCHDRFALPVPLGGIGCGENAIVINAPGATVTLRNINISTFNGVCATNGVSIEAASVVNIEDCLIDSFPQSGISVTTSANTILNVVNTRIRNAANGISLAPTGGAVNGSIDHAIIAKMSGSGITSAGSVYFTVTNSLVVNAAGTGVSSGPGAVLEVNSSSISNNRTAFATTGGTIRISHNLIYDNTANYSIAGGVIATSDDNKVAVNGSTVPNGTITRQ